jgi:hypothetical protein
MRALFYDRNSRPISELEWHRLGRRSGYRRVDYTDGIRHGRRITVVTYWLGIDDGQAPGQPLIFHTYASFATPPISMQATGGRGRGPPSRRPATPTRRSQRG